MSRDSNQSINIPNLPSSRNSTNPNIRYSKPGPAQTIIKTQLSHLPNLDRLKKDNNHNIIFPNLAQQLIIGQILRDDLIFQTWPDSRTFKTQISQIPNLDWLKKFANEHNLTDLAQELIIARSCAMIPYSKPFPAKQNRKTFPKPGPPAHHRVGLARCHVIQNNPNI